MIDSSADHSARGRRVGLYGGSFDPVHDGHLHAARAALAAFDLDRVVFVPARQSPHKQDRESASGAQRVAMLELAIAGQPRFQIDTLELERPGPSYTIDTVRALPARLGEPPDCAIYFVLGSDNVEAFPTWREARALVERVEPVVVYRDGDPPAQLERIERELGAAAAAKFARGYLKLPPVEVSSTELRGSLAIGGASRLRVPEAVLAYIRAQGLYGANV